MGKAWPNLLVHPKVREEKKMSKQRSWPQGKKKKPKIRTFVFVFVVFEKKKSLPHDRSIVSVVLEKLDEQETVDEDLLDQWLGFFFFQNKNPPASPPSPPLPLKVFCFSFSLLFFPFSENQCNEKYSSGNLLVPLLRFKKKN